MTLIAIAAVAFGLLALAWLAYPAAMWLRATARASATGIESPPTERVVVVVATRDDPAFAVERVRNLRATEYPANLIRVVVAVDVNSSHSIDSYRTALSGLADVVPGDAPGGKATTLNAGVRAASPGADVLVFADVGQEFSARAIPELVAALRDGSTGAVTGRYTHGRTDGLMSAYADLEALIRAGQAAGRSVVSASGSILAMRPSLWRDLPEGLICDDLYTGLSVVRQGSRVGFCPEAIAWDPRVFTRDQQFTRRVRTLTGLIQYCVIVPGVLLPWRNPVWSHFFIHKVLRLLTPILFAIGVAALGVWLTLRAPIVVAAAVAVFALLALEFRVMSPTRFRRVWDQAIWSLRLLVIPVVAISNGLRGRWSVWTPTSQARADLRQTGA
jgi:cellulose synthase/poly-beta-1,6-N-acetylglucosamine synthase-like glycosyltransferase